MIHITTPDLVADVGALLIRFVVGFSFIIASRNKSKDIKKFAKGNGLPVPAAIFVMIAEMAGGLGLILGILPQFAALGLMLLMLGTIRLHIFKWRSPYWTAKGGWEYDLMLFALASVILVHGAGKFAIAQ
jgi:putative oxidoreductase